MNYAEAKKKLAAEKPKENYMVMKFTVDYECQLILPHKDGLAIIAAMANAEILNDRYSGQKGIDSIDRETFSSRMISYAEYLRYKMAQLLGITPDELKNLEQPEKPEANSGQ